MSLINQMLRDLEERQGAGEGRPLVNEVRPLPASKPSIAPKVAVASALVLAVVGSLYWWSRPMPRAVEKPAPPAPTIVAVSPPAIAPSPPAAVQIMKDSPASGPQPPAVKPPAAEPRSANLASKPGGNAEATTTAMAILSSSRAAPAVPTASPPDILRPDPDLSLKPSIALSSLSSVDRGAVPLVSGKSAPMPAAQSTAGPVVIEKQVRLATARERAESEYRKAIQSVNQGNSSEAMLGLRAALQEDPSYAVARQTLAGMLVEQRRLAEAEAVLQEGLAQNLAQPNLAMRVARIRVERGDLQAAHEVLQRSAASGDSSAEYRALHAGVLQRLGQHREAAEYYQAALRMAPQMNVWWMGLGISLEQEGRIADARAAFQRARSGGALSADLDVFVEQKLRQLQ